MVFLSMIISIHEALASLDFTSPLDWDCILISIHEALASLDKRNKKARTKYDYFDPRGSREPRQKWRIQSSMLKEFRSTRLSRASTALIRYISRQRNISIHEALASLDKCKEEYYSTVQISIHEALASLDSYSIFDF